MSDASYSNKSDTPEVVINPTAKADEKPKYPYLEIPEEVRKKIDLPIDLIPGDKVTATVVLCVTKVVRSDDEKDYDKSRVCFDVEDIEPEEVHDSEKGGESSKDKSDEEKMLGYKRETPGEKAKIKPTSGKDLEKY